MELKPCPFCDGEAYQPDEGVYVWCSNRNCIGTNAVGNTDEWNTRPIEDELRARIKELEEKLAYEQEIWHDVYDNDKDEAFQDDRGEMN